MENHIRNISVSPVQGRAIDSPAGVVWGWIITTGILLLLAALPAFCESTYRGNPQHTGLYDASGVPKLKGVKWTFHAASRLVSSTVVVDRELYFGGTDENLCALNYI